MASDPTIDFLRSLEDPAKFVKKENVPIWVPHTRKNPDGTVTKVTEADLPDYAEFINRVERERGVAGRVTDGHIMKVVDGKPVMVSPPPKLMGYYKGAVVGTFGEEETPAVLTTVYYRNEPDVLQIAKDRPYRSPEVYTAVKQIRGLALLLNDPFLDMGVVTYDAEHLPVCYGGDHMPGEAMGGKNAAMGGEGKPEEKEKPDHSPEEKELFEKVRAYMCKTYGLDENWPGKSKEEANPEAKPGDKPEEKPKGEVTPMEKDKVPEQYARQMGEMRAQLAGIQLERDQERCQFLLYSLENEGFSLTPDEKKKELAKLVKIPTAGREERVKELKAIYAERKVPRGRMELYGGPVEGGTPDENDPFAEPAYHQAAMQYMLNNPGMLYEKAVAHVQASKRQ